MKFWIYLIEKLKCLLFIKHKTFPLKLHDKREIWEIIDDSENPPRILVNFSDSLSGG